MYCTVDDMSKLLPEAVKIGDTNIGTPNPGNQVAKRDNISIAKAEFYISYAQQHIDSLLRPYYSCPLRRTKINETTIVGGITAGNNVTVTVYDSGSFARGDMVRIQNLGTMELATIKEVKNITQFILNTVVNSYVDGSLISIVEYPDPIPVITARYAASFAIDSLWSNSQSPDVSNYGKTQRNLAIAQLENILAGAIQLFGQEHTGRRFVRISLFDAWKTAAELQKGTEKENA